MQSSKALVLIDLENQWTEEGSDYFLGDLSDLVQSINGLIDHCRTQGYKIIFVRHVEPDSTTVFAEGTSSIELLPDLHTDEDDVVVTKYTIGSFYNTDMDAALEGITEVVVAGVLTNLCVRSFVSDAYDRGFGITIVADCCKAFDEETHAFTLRDLKNTREEIEIVSLDDIISL
jgi:nicotinamidase-related amidase